MAVQRNMVKQHNGWLLYIYSSGLFNKGPFIISTGGGW